MKQSWTLLLTTILFLSTIPQVYSELTQDILDAIDEIVADGSYSTSSCDAYNCEECYTIEQVEEWTTASGTFTESIDISTYGFAEGYCITCAGSERLVPYCYCDSTTSNPYDPGKEEAECTSYYSGYVAILTAEAIAAAEAAAEEEEEEEEEEEQTTAEALAALLAATFDTTDDIGEYTSDCNTDDCTHCVNQTQIRERMYYVYAQAGYGTSAEGYDILTQPLLDICINCEEENRQSPLCICNDGENPLDWSMFYAYVGATAYSCLTPDNSATYLAMGEAANVEAGTLAYEEAVANGEEYTPTTIADMMTSLLALPTSYIDTDCVSNHCEECFNQTVIYAMTKIMNVIKGTSTIGDNVYIVGFQDVCQTCSTGRLAPFCICDDGEDVNSLNYSYSWDGYEDCLNLEEAVAAEEAFNVAYEQFVEYSALVAEEEGEDYTAPTAPGLIDTLAVLDTLPDGFLDSNCHVTVGCEQCYNQSAIYEISLFGTGSGSNTFLAGFSDFCFVCPGVRYPPFCHCGDSTYAFDIPEDGECHTFMEAYMAMLTRAPPTEAEQEVIDDAAAAEIVYYGELGVPVPTAMEKLSAGLAQIPSDLYDGECEMAHCALCINQTVIYKLTEYMGAASPTDLITMSGGVLKDICLVCSDATRMAPFCICNDLDNQYDYPGSAECKTAAEMAELIEPAAATISYVNITKTREDLAQLPDYLWESDCQTPNCEFCVNQSTIYVFSLGATDIYPYPDMCMVCLGNATRSTPFCNCTYPSKEFESEDCGLRVELPSPMKNIVFLAGVLFIVNFGFMIAAKFLKL